MEISELKANTEDKAQRLVTEFEKEILFSPFVKRVQKSTSRTLSIAEEDESSSENDSQELQNCLEQAEADLNSKCQENENLLKALGSKEDDLHSEIYELQTENTRLQEDTMNCRMELEMSRTLGQELEERILHVETSKANLTKHIQSSKLLSSESNESLAKTIKEKDEEIVSRCKELEEAQKENLALQAESDRRTEEYHAEAKKVEAMHIGMKELDSNIAMAYLRIESQEEVTKEAERDLQDKQSRLESLEKDLVEAEGKLKESEQQIDCLRKKELELE
jgi:chromosome segregation ATPase